MHNSALSCGDFGGKTPPQPSVYFRLMAPGKDLAPAQNTNLIRSDKAYTCRSNATIN